MAGIQEEPVDASQQCYHGLRTLRDKVDATTDEPTGKRPQTTRTTGSSAEKRLASHGSNGNSLTCTTATENGLIRTAVTAQQRRKTALLA